MNHNTLHSSLGLLLSAIFLFVPLWESVPASAQAPSVFEMPARMTQYRALELQTVRAIRAGKYDQAIRLCEAAIEQLPIISSAYYNLACAHAGRGDLDGAFRNLDEAMDRGLKAVEHMRKDTDLKRLHPDPRWTELINRSDQPATKTYRQQVTPSTFVDGVAKVTETNTVWEPGTGQLKVLFRPTPNQTAGAKNGGGEDQPSGIVDRNDPIVLRGGKVGQLLNQWWKEGTAAGLYGVLYDNHDRKHSQMDFAKFPQITRIEYDTKVKSLGLDHGLQRSFLFNSVTIGNSSTSNVGGFMWRSQPRLAFMNQALTKFLATQYYSNHAYVYPEHRDHDADGSGDTYPANTPYVTISQGSSYSDRVFLDAFACTLAALRPQTKQLLERNRMIAPTLQMIMRRCYDGIQSDDDYLTGRAHPTVFDGKKIDAQRMIELAHELTPTSVPPIALLKIEREDLGIPGRDYFEIGPREALFSTVGAIARICRKPSFRRKMIISASGSKDLTGKSLTFHWAVLRGDPEKIKIKQLNEEGSRAEIEVEYHERGPIDAGSSIQSQRVDIGVFVSNGDHFSPPAFVSFSWPSNETRTYDKKQRIKEVVYHDVDDAPYIDSAIITPSNWRDVYHYGSKSILLGWTRHRGDHSESFTAAGLLVKSRDDQGRPLVAEQVRYSIKPRGKKAPILFQSATGKEFRYEYADVDDLIGKIKIVPGNEKPPEATEKTST